MAGTLIGMVLATAGGKPSSDADPRPVVPGARPVPANFGSEFADAVRVYPQLAAEVASGLA